MARTSTRFAEILCAIVDGGNYTQAAQQLGLTPGAVSKAVARQEAALGIQLFRRNTRSMQLSPPGRAYYDECKKALQLLEHAEHSLRANQEQAEGRVKVSVPTTYGHYRVLPFVHEFTAQHPRIALELDVSNENVDLVTGRCDLAVRMGEIKGGSLVVRKLEQASVGTFAAPSYLERYGFPAHPSELAQHTCIGFIRPSTGRPIRWGFFDARRRALEVEPSRSLRCSGDVLACVALARHGAGLVQSYHFVVEEDVRLGRLIEVLRPFAGRSAPFSLLQPPGRRLTLPVRLFADWLVARCAS